MFIYRDVAQTGSRIAGFNAGKDILDLRDLMLMAGDHADVDIRQGEAGAEIWMNDPASGHFIITTLEDVDAGKLAAGTNIWL